MDQPEHLRAAFDEFLENIEGQSAASRYNYTRRLRGFLDAHGNRPLNAIEPGDVNRWHEALGARGYEEATLAGYRQALKALFNFCVGRGWVLRSPAAHLKIGKFTKRTGAKLPPESAVEAMAAIAQQWLYSEDVLELRNGLIFLISYLSGPRSGEIRSLKKTAIEDALELGPDQWGVYRAVTKGKTKDVTIRFNEEVAAGMRRWLAVRPKEARIDRCFVTIRAIKTPTDPVTRYRPLTASGLIRAYQHVARAAGLPKAIYSHKMRHRVGDKTTKKYGAKVAAIILNHKDQDTAATAIAFYHHPDESDVSRAIMAADESNEFDHLARRLFGLE
jgi:integrase